MPPDRWLDRKSRPELRTQRPRPGKWVKVSKIKPRDIHVVHRRGWLRPRIGPTDLEKRAVPRTQVLGSLHERIVYKELARRGINFDFQPSVQGGRLQLGGMVADFILPDRMLVIRVQGTKWHTSFAAGKKDEAQKTILQGYNFTVMDIWDWQIEDDDLRRDWFERNIDVGVPM